MVTCEVKRVECRPNSRVQVQDLQMPSFVVI